MTVFGKVAVAKSNVAKGFCFCYREPWPDTNSLVDRVGSVAITVSFENPWNITISRSVLHCLNPHFCSLGDYVSVGCSGMMRMKITSYDWW